MTEVLHALISGLLAAGVYYGLRSAGMLDGKTRMQQFLFLAPIFFVVVLIFNLIWPYGP
ncbi:hypothetical protein SAMN05444007_10810 [Cribrihabitans marinus]|jgi:hypothetical protein|uniref:Uncharacterized protein n=1 Tax=Cribrihabitans marinus TaxID=1227549 RepID=A0A1H7C9J4_9RHOB|nr:hypothetical protein [Cribrihabitans marinus]GGH34869.1 hypothetical protein GCM10010973_27810 [Cribrihabitans marinus]SEJ86361.1 hypothetical protein SAMN05444007_10810 [Cribrihabitans marinus]